MTDEIKEEQPQEPLIIDKAIMAAERLEAANKKQEELMQKQEQLLARQALGGRSTLTPEPKLRTEQDEILEQANLLLKPYGIDLNNNVTANTAEVKK